MNVLDPGFASGEPDVGHVRRCQTLLIRYFFSAGYHVILYYIVMATFYVLKVIFMVCVCARVCA